MSTVRQKKLAKSFVENLQADKPLNKQELVASVGYSHKVADKKATEIIESKGVQKELKALGFDSETAKEVVAEILVYGDSDMARLAAAREVFKVHGDYAPEKSVNVNVQVENTEKIQQATALLNDIYRRGSESGDGEPSRALDDKTQD